MKLYNKKSAQVEAVQWIGNNEAEIKEFCPNVIIRKVYFATTPITYQTEIIIQHNLRDAFVNVGDFIMKDKYNDFWPCKKDAFYEMYEEVKQDDKI